MKNALLLGDLDSRSHTRLCFRALLALSLALTPLFLTGCASTIARFNVEAEREAIPIQGNDSYWLIVRFTGWPTDRSLLAETKTCVRRALASKGLHEASAAAAASTIIVVDLGIGAPRPQTVLEYDHFPERLAWPTSTVVVVDPNSETRYDDEGLPMNRVMRASRPKFLRVTACERDSAAGRGTTRVLWHVDVANDDESAELGSYMPLMVAAAMDSLVPTGKGTSTVEIASSDRRVFFVRTQK